MKKVLIFDPDYRGHHLQFVSVLIDAVAEKCGSKTLVVAAVCRQASTSPEGQIHLSNLPDNTELDDSLEFPPLAGLFKNAKFRLNQLIQSVNRHQPDHIFIPYGDGLIQLMGMGMGSRRLNQCPSQALILHGHQKPGIKNRLKSHAYHRLFNRASCKRIHFLNPQAYDTALRINHPKVEKFNVMPEPVEVFDVENQAAARARINVPVTGKIVACLGGINTQKNVDGLITAFVAAEKSSSDRLLLVGKQDELIGKQLASMPTQSKRQIIEINRYVENQFFLDAIVASDVVTIPYRNRGASSGILVRAVRARKKIITDQGGFLGKLTREFNFGHTCDVSDPNQFSETIADCLSTCDDIQESQAKQRFREFHTTKNFCHHWTETLDTEAMDRAHGETKTWNWVIAGLKELPTNV